MINIPQSISEFMKLKSSLIVLFAIGTIFLGAYFPNFGDPKEKEIVILEAVLDVLRRGHFEPIALDDAFSKKVFKTYVESIDRGKRFMTQSDIEQLKAHELSIDDQAEARTFEFFELSLDILNNGIDRSKTFYEEIIAQPFDLTKDETIELDEEKKPFAGSEAELKEYWRKSLKYEVLTKVLKKLKDQENKDENEKEKEGLSGKISDLTKKVKEIATSENNDGIDVIKSIEQLEIEAREDVKEVFDDWYKRMDKMKRSDRFEAYLNSFTRQYDPHSSYFNPKEKQDFDINMGGKLEGIGARLQQDGDYVKISSIVVGGPAWKGKELEENDLIMAVTQKGEEPLDIIGMRVDDAVTYIRGKKGTVVILTVKKEDESIVDIEIERDEVIIDESFARSIILDIPGVAKNVGYIKLPKFYSSFEKEDGNSCAVDVEKEIEKLKAQNVSGIILDLRFNTGGSLNDVVAMSGLFIEEGPIVQVKPREPKAPYVYDDPDSGVAWDGPLAVMVNSYSASASEILAAALQDYDRAVIVGGTSTFGKGTVQRFFDLDQYVRGNSTHKPLGQVKITLQKFFRVNGGSTQLKGVEPDIVFPDQYTYVDVGEKEYEDAMEWTEINALTYDQNVMRINNMPLLKSKSEKRIKNNIRFGMANENALRYKDIRDQSEFPINLEDYRAVMEQREKDAEKYEDLFDEEVVGLTATNLGVDVADIKADESKQARNDEWIEKIKKDFYLEEVMYIMRDLMASS